jgi:hypothetical protein
VNDLIQLEVTDRYVFSPYAESTDPKLMKLVERYLIERSRLKHAGVRLKDHPPLLAKTLGMSINDVISLIEYVEIVYSSIL